jgi:hypothetical protein
LSHSTSPFFCVCDRFFRDRVWQTLYLGWLQTVILLISASRVARITSMSHWCPAVTFLTGSCIFAQVNLDHSPVYAPPHSLDDRCTPPHPAYWLR